MALTKVINDLADLNQSDSTNALKGCAGTTAQQPASSSSIEYLIVAGGGGGGTNGSATGDGLGGGGAGGYVTGTTTAYQGAPSVLTVGNGGDGGTTTNGYDGINGNDSGFNGIRAIGGGGGGAGTAPGLDGGSGGGGGRNADPAYHSIYYGYALNNQGNNGGSGGYTPGSYQASTGGGGGGYTGAGTAGANSASGNGGAGGAGVNVKTFIDYTNSTLAQIADVSGTDVYVAGGGGGGAYSGTKGTGGSGGGGAGGQASTNAEVGLRNSGGGGGGDGNAQSLGGNGGSGVVVLKYDNTIVTGYSLNSEDTYTVNWPADKYGVAYWPLNLDVKDVGGHYDGTATDITYTNGKFNQAASFNGSSSHIDVSNGLGTSGDRTRSVWIYISGLPGAGSGETIYYLGPVGSNAYYESLLVREISGSYHIRWHDRYNTVDDDILNSTTTVTTDVWYHVAIVRDGTTQKMYINGSLDNSRTNTYSIVDNTAYPLAIGQWNGGTPCCYYEGLMEQLRFYTSALSDSDILDIYNNSKPGSLPPLKTSSDLTYNVCDYPSSAGAQGLFIFDGNITDTCSNITFTAASSGTLVSSYGTGKFASESAFWNGTYSSLGNTMETSYAWLSNAGAFTVSLWVKYEEAANPSYQSMLMSNSTSWSTYGGIILHTYGASNSSYPDTVMFSFTSSTGLGSPTWRIWRDIPGGWANNWVHLAMSQNSAGLKKAYINGIKVGEDSSAVTTIGEHNLTFGGYNGYTNDRFKGDMSNLRIYNESLSDQHVYDLWQKENAIQTYFPNAPTSGTDTLVFKEGSGEITFKNDTPPGAEIGMLRHNSTLGQMEHFNSGGWKDFTNCTTSVCNYPTTAKLLYQFNNNTHDTCNNYNPTSITDITYRSGKFNLAASFNGSSSYIEYANFGGVLNTANAFSYSFWVYFNSIGTYDWVIGLQQAGSPYAGVGLFGGSSNNLGIALGGAGPAVMTGTLSLSTWIHIAFTHDGSGTYKCYVDGGNPIIYSGVTSSLSSNPLRLGYSSVSGWDYLDGNLDQVRIFSSELTSTQVTQLYNETYCP